jgi:hypothetical protein
VTHEPRLADPAGEARDVQFLQKKAKTEGRRGSAVPVGAIASVM